VGTSQTAGRPRRPEEIQAWLREHPSLTELCDAYPDEWRTVQHDIDEVLARGDAEEFKAYAAAVARAPDFARSPRRNRDQEARALVRREMTAARLRELAVSAATGISHGRIRFNLLNGYAAQKLLFARDLERKPVSLRWFGLVWPLLWQRRLLMPLVGRKGIYCFYSKELLTELAALIADRPCLEIAAGDGTLSRLLTAQGVEITATDDYSWDHSVSYSTDVERLDAVKALRRYQPAVVLCSWPPAGNSFEREVFRTASVKLYIVIGSKHEMASGDWNAYRKQRGFALAEDPTLSRLVLPPELDSAVHVFRRIGQS
jgi:hypothetical protein